MVMAGVKDTAKAPAVFVECGVQIYAAISQKHILYKVTKPYTRWHFKNHPPILQARTHATNTILAFFKNDFSGTQNGDFWPSDSLQINSTAILFRLFCRKKSALFKISHLKC